MKNAVTYLRVSTSKQGLSGLGLEAQKAAVQKYILSNGLTVVSEFVEIESGTSKGKRIEIYRAIELAKQNNAVLVIAKLDRLSRNLHFVTGLMESGVNFVCVDNPTANPLTIQIMACLAENEAKLISERTKSALIAAKNRGTVLGNPNGINSSVREKATAAIKRNALAAYSQISGYMLSLRENGKSLAEIAHKLNIEGHKTRQGKLWNPIQVSRVLQKFS